MSPNHPSSSSNSSGSVLPSYQQTTTTTSKKSVDVDVNNSDKNDVNCYYRSDTSNKNHALFQRVCRAFSLDYNKQQSIVDQESSSSSSLSPEMQKLSPRDKDDEDEQQQYHQYQYHRNDNSNNSNRFFLSFMRGIAMSVLLVMAVGMFFICAHYYHKHAEIPAAAAAAAAATTTCHVYSSNNNNNDNNDSWNAAFAQKASLTGLIKAAVAADHPLCSQMGLDIIQGLGGNAVDAAVTVALCLGVANPASSGIGGGAFMLVHANREHFFQKQVDNNNNNDMITMPTFRDARSVEDQEREKQQQQEASSLGKTNNNNNNKQKRAMMMTEVVDCREVAPAAATRDMYLHRPTQDSERGGLAIGVPGELRGLELAHARHGKLKWSQVLEPVAALAERGVVVNANLANEIGIIQRRYNGTSSLSTLTTVVVEPFAEPLRQILTHNNDWNTPLQQGDLLKNPALAKTLRRIQTHGANAIYKDEAAAQWAADIQAVGGIVTKDDLESYQATLRSPVVGQGNMQGLTVVGVPPPSSGGAAIIGAIRFLANFQNSANSPPLSRRATTLSQHRMVEATKHAFAIRMSMSDPDYNTDTVQDAVNDLVHSDYMQTLQQTVHDDSATLPLSQYGGSKWAQLKDSDGQAPIVPDAKEGDRRRRRRRVRRLSDQDVYNNDDLVNGEPPRMGGRPFGYLNDGGTSHFSILDGDGNAVSMTTSVNTYFGSNVVSPSTGILLSNTMDDFSSPGRPNYFGLQPSTANYISAGKKPLSSMSPTLVFAKDEEQDDDNNDWGNLVLVLGASGGPKIISAVFRVLVNHLFLGMDLWQAIIDPRLHDQLIYHGAAVTTFEESTVNVNGDSDDDDMTTTTTSTLVHNITVEDRILQALQKRGHGLLEVDYEGTVQAIAVDVDTKELTAVCDPRKGGSPSGF